MPTDRSTRPDARGLTQLGSKSVLTDAQLADPRAILEAFPNPRPQRDYTIQFVFPEFTSVCPVTGQPDFATITVRYVPNELCVEMKSLKLYYFSYRNKGIFYEAVTNTILDDLVAVLKPRRMTVIGDFAVRGGTAGTVTVEYEAAITRDGAANGSARKPPRRRGRGAVK
jgi:7-cyano-7-deazaguanine reductase